MALRGNIEQSGHRRCLVIGPLVLQHPVLEHTIVVGSRADVDNEVGIGVVLIEVASHIVN